MPYPMAHWRERFKWAREPVLWGRHTLIGLGSKKALLFQVRMPDIFVGSSYVKYFCCNIIKLLDFRFDTILGGLTLLRSDDRGRIMASDTLSLVSCPPHCIETLKNDSTTILWNRGGCRTNAPQMAGASFSGPNLTFLSAFHESRLAAASKPDGNCSASSPV